MAEIKRFRTTCERCQAKEEHEGEIPKGRISVYALVDFAPVYADLCPQCAIGSTSLKTSC